MFAQAARSSQERCLEPHCAVAAHPRVSHHDAGLDLRARAQDAVAQTSAPSPTIARGPTIDPRTEAAAPTVAPSINTERATRVRVPMSTPSQATTDHSSMASAAMWADGCSDGAAARHGPRPRSASPTASR